MGRYNRAYYYGKLEDMLRGVAHAPGCLNLGRCPQVCGCRAERRFELDTNTAMCWEIALLLGANKWIQTKYEREKIEHTIQAYRDLAEYHETKGWVNLFYEIYHLFIRANGIHEDRTNRQNTIAEESLTYLRKVIPRLKRTTKRRGG